MILTGENRRTRRKTCPSAILYTTKSTYSDPGLRGERLATKKVLINIQIVRITRKEVCHLRDKYHNDLCYERNYSDMAVRFSRR
jgi:hypothetical protein